MYWLVSKLMQFFNRLILAQFRAAQGFGLLRARLCVFRKVAWLLLSGDNFYCKRVLVSITYGSDRRARICRLSAALNARFQIFLTFLIVLKHPASLLERCLFLQTLHILNLLWKHGFLSFVKRKLRARGGVAQVFMRRCNLVFKFRR